MKWNELRRIAEQNGWYLLRKGGNHDIYAHAERNELLKIERYGAQEIKVRLVLQIKKIDRVLIGIDKKI